MKEQTFEKRIEDRWERRMRRHERRIHRYNSGKGRIWIGVFLLIIGGLFLARETGAILFPSWFFTWPVLLIALGLLSGFRHGFRGIGWLILVAVGGFFLYDKISPEVSFRPYLWPVILIALGLFVIFRPRKRWHPETSDVNSTAANDNAPAPATFGEEWGKATNDRNDTIDITAVFGGVKKNFLSKHFKGGDITAFMGGAEINLSQADFSGKVVIDCFNMFGGTKIIVPPDWDVQSDIVAIFGGVEDKRPPAAQTSTGKVLLLDGTCIFGGVEIKSF